MPVRRDEQKAKRRAKRRAKKFAAARPGKLTALRPGVFKDEQGRQWVDEAGAEARGTPREVLWLLSNQEVYIPKSPTARRIRRFVLHESYTTAHGIAGVCSWVNGRPRISLKFVRDLEAFSGRDPSLLPLRERVLAAHAGALWHMAVADVDSDSYSEDRLVEWREAVLGVLSDDARDDFHPTPAELAAEWSEYKAAKGEQAAEAGEPNAPVA